MVNIENREKIIQLLENPLDIVKERIVNGSSDRFGIEIGMWNRDNVVNKIECDCG